MSLVIAATGGCSKGKSVSSPSRSGSGAGETKKSSGDLSVRSREADTSEVLVASAAPKKDTWKPRPAPEPQAGLLTAGSFDDNFTPEPFRRFASKLRQDAGPGDLPARLFGRRLVVTVRGEDGKPGGNARVRISGNVSQQAVELLTRSDGHAVFLSSWDGVEGDLLVTVTPPGGAATVKQLVARDATRCEVALPQAAAPLPKNLDLVLVLDTTGSMGDELVYLKSEVKSIASAVAAKFPHVSQRYGLVVYRDRGDEYVTRTFDFTPSVEEFRRRLSAQSAAGGGDYPESMERGLEEAVKLQWRSADTARVLFLVADAPPHAADVGKAMAAADTLRKKGVAIYPVACSGYDDTTELVMRTCALLTGSQFLFLTNDSGVGDAHGEPHIPFYHVQRLDRLMIRMIADELSGRRVEPAPADILRTVGSPPRVQRQ
jgi:hypothetical protein